MTTEGLTKESALSLLASPRPHDRLNAAVALVAYVSEIDPKVVRDAYDRESESWVKMRLGRLLQRLDGEVQPSESDSAYSLPQHVIEEVKAQAVEETTKLIVHELRPMVGRLGLYVESDVSSFDAAKMRAEIGRMKSLLDAIDNLSRAASAPQYSQFDLPTLLDEIGLAETEGHTTTVALIGRRPLAVTGDKTIVEIVFSNGLRNAIEAIESLEESRRSPIVINWDVTDRDSWITILDEGPGLPIGMHRIFNIGLTSKFGHSGMGLAIAEQASDSIGGTLKVTPREKGVHFEFRWPDVDVAN